MNIEERNTNQRRIQKFDSVNAELSKLEEMLNWFEQNRTILKVNIIFPYSEEIFHQDYLSEASEKLIKNEIKDYIQKRIVILKKELDQI